MERFIIEHKCGVVNEALTVRAVGEPGPGGANCRYKIDGPEKDWGMGIGKIPQFQCDIRFQNGNPAAGINGITNEALLAVLIDRLTGFQSGPFACLENENALECCRQALQWLHNRTQGRVARGVEGEQKA